MIPKRTFWAGLGYGAGLATSFYLRKRVQRALGPRGVDAAVRAKQAARGVRAATRSVTEAVREGRATMRDTERALRAEFEVHRRV